MGAKRTKVKDAAGADSLPPAHLGVEGGEVVAPISKPAAVRGKCPHNRRKSLCKDCGGVGVCGHGRHKYRCKDCNGCSICDHGRIKYDCKECKGAGVCEHGRQKSRCKDCGGKGVCVHNKRRSICKECGGSAICVHQRVKYSCKECLAQKLPAFDTNKGGSFGVMPIIDVNQAPPPPVGVPQMLAMAAAQMGQQLGGDMMHSNPISMHGMQPIPATSMHGMPPAPTAPQPRRAALAAPSMQDIAADIHGMPPN